MTVADLDSSLQSPLSIDFLKRHNPYLDLSGGMLCCGEAELCLFLKPDASCHFVLLKSAVVLPAGKLTDVVGVVTMRLVSQVLMDVKL